MEKWFAFKAYNSQTVHGFGTEAEAEAYADVLNKGKEVNLYAAYALSDGQAEEQGLADNTEAFNLSEALANIED